MIVRSVVAPVGAGFGLVLVMILFAVRHPVRRPDRSSTAAPSHELGPLLRHLLVTAAGGYAIFVAVIAVFSVWIVGDVGALASAAWSGALFIGMAMVLFPPLVAVQTRWRDRRTGGRGRTGDARADAG